MTTAEKIELAVIPLAGCALWLLALVLPGVADVGTLLLWAAALFLFQGLLRDFWLLALQRRATLPGGRRKERCMCVESTVGVTGVIAGLALPCLGWHRLVVMDGWSWSLSGMAVVAAGFALKDYVVFWRPLRLRREKDHVNIIFTWQK